MKSANATLHHPNASLIPPPYAAAPCPTTAATAVAGGTCFFTVTLQDRRTDLLVATIEALRAAVRRTRTRRPFHIDAWVVLPEHLHCLWTLPESDSDYSGRWRAIKAAFSHGLPPTEPRSSVQHRRSEHGIWQHRFWQHTIRDEHDYAAHMDYVHFNPVKHGLVSDVAAWPFSTFRRCVAQGFYPTSRAGGNDLAQAGERR